MGVSPRRFRIGTGALLGLLLLVAGVVAVIATPLASPQQPAYSSAPDDSSDNPICREAAALIDAGRPADALTLIAAGRDEAKAQTATANAAPICARQLTASLVARAQLERGASAKSSWAQMLAFRWNSYVADTAAPLGSIGLAALGIVLVALILARLAIYAPFQPLGLRSGIAVTSTPRRAVGVLCLLAMVLASLGIVYGLSLDARVAGRGGVLPVLAGIATSAGALAELIAAGCFSTLLAARLRIVIDITGASDPSLAPRLAALISEIGGALPRGVEVPTGSDVTALRDDVIAVKSSVPLVSALQTLAGWLLVTAPWRVTVGLTNDSATLSMLMTRNGHSTAGFTISSATLVRPGRSTLPAGTVELLQSRLLDFAAAAVVTTLARFYAGFDGLCGTTDWKSLGLQFVATTTRLAPDETRQLLAWSLSADPANLLALLALRRLRAADLDSPADRRRYVDWLCSVLAEIDARNQVSTPEARVRLLLLAVIEQLNLRGVSGRRVPTWVTRRADQLVAELEELDKRSPLYKQMRPSALIARACARVHGGCAPSEDLEVVRSLLPTANSFTAYNAASYFTLVLSSADRDHRDVEVRRDLRQALATALLDPASRERATRDPILRSLATSPWYRRLVNASTRASTDRGATGSDPNR